MSDNIKDLLDTIDTLATSVADLGIDPVELKNLKRKIKKSHQHRQIVIFDDDWTQVAVSYEEYPNDEDPLKGDWLLGIDTKHESLTLTMSNLQPLIDVLQELKKQKDLDF